MADPLGRLFRRRSAFCVAETSRNSLVASLSGQRGPVEVREWKSAVDDGGYNSHALQMGTVLARS